jgi:hypothetical protein
MGAVALVTLVVTADLAVGGALARSGRMLRDPLDSVAALAPLDLDSYYRPSTAASFLREQMAAEPARYVGYAPHVDAELVAYTLRFFDASTADLLVNNRAVALGLHDVQGYDPSHLQRFDDYLRAMNGTAQDYHNADVFPRGLSSPLLDLLNARFVVVPADAAPPPGFVQVYSDPRVRIVENPRALARAWIVHEALHVPGSAPALDLIANGNVDARRTAVLEEAPPPLETPADPSLDWAVISDYAADRIVVQTSTTASGLLVLSEMYYPAWQAYVDGQRVRLYLADGALRAVPVPAGEHVVELRFESTTLAVGIAISVVTVLGILGGGSATLATCRSSRDRTTCLLSARVSSGARMRLRMSSSC